MKKITKETFTYKKTGVASRLVNFFLGKVIVGKMDFHFHDEVPTEASIFVGNHTEFVGPLAIQYKYPTDVRTWSEALLLQRKSCNTLFKEKVLKNLKGGKFFRLFLPLTVPLIAWYYRKQLNCIPVYRDTKVMTTFKESITTLMHGVHIAIYPEVVGEKMNEVICKMATGFVYLAFSYYKATGKKVKFYPLYCAQSIKQTHFGKPIEYNPDIPIKEQAITIIEYIEEQITEIARSLPRHRLVTIDGKYKAQSV